MPSPARPDVRPGEPSPLLLARRELREVGAARMGRLQKLLAPVVDGARVSGVGAFDEAPISPSGRRDQLGVVTPVKRGRLANHDVIGTYARNRPVHVWDASRERMYAALVASGQLRERGAVYVFSRSNALHRPLRSASITVPDGLERGTGVNAAPSTFFTSA